MSPSGTVLWIGVDFDGRCHSHVVHKIKIKTLFSEIPCTRAILRAPYHFTWLILQGTTLPPSSVVDAIWYCENLSTLVPLGTKKRHFHIPKCHRELNIQYQETWMIFLLYNKMKILKIKYHYIFHHTHLPTKWEARGHWKENIQLTHRAHVTVLVLDDVTLHWSLFQMVLSLYCMNLLLQKPTAQTLELID